MAIKFCLEKTWHKFIAFGIIGVVAFVVDWAIFNAVYALSAIFLLSISIAWVISMGFNFIINRNYTFNARGHEHHHVGKQLFKWLTMHTIAFLARAGLGKAVLFLLGPGILNANIAFFSGLVVSIPITFFGSLFWAFKKKSA